MLDIDKKILELEGNITKLYQQKSDKENLLEFSCYLENRNKQIKVFVDEHSLNKDILKIINILKSPQDESWIDENRFVIRYHDIQSSNVDKICLKLNEWLSNTKFSFFLAHSQDIIRDEQLRRFFNKNFLYFSSHNFNYIFEIKTLKDNNVK